MDQSNDIVEEQCKCDSQIRLKKNRNASAVIKWFHSECLAPDELFKLLNGKKEDDSNDENSVKMGALKWLIVLTASKSINLKIG